MSNVFINFQMENDFFFFLLDRYATRNILALFDLHSLAVNLNNVGTVRSTFPQGAWFVVSK